MGCGTLRSKDSQRRFVYYQENTTVLMKYVLSIDWLSVFCVYMGADNIWSPVDGDGFAYKKEDFGTRCFSRFHRVRIANAEGGWDDFAEVQSIPYSSILPEYAIIIRFVNRVLYAPDFWELAARFLSLNRIEIRGISRIDICADFNQFATMDPKALIDGFAAKKYRHIGRGVGSLAFNHGVLHKEYGVNYTGLTFGTHASDAHCYLYDKSFELVTQGEKPWIRERWKRVGLDQRNVWRLEVSIKSGGLKFKDKTTKQVIEVGQSHIEDADTLDKIYHTFVRKLFSFIVNRSGIKNITREPRLVLFEGKAAFDRGTLSNLSVGSRMERILIKSLWLMSDRYRGAYIYGAREQAQRFAETLAASTGLYNWLQEKKPEWETPIHK